jgi:hypothetical protein
MVGRYDLGDGLAAVFCRAALVCAVIDILDTDVDALNISPRVGINAELGPCGDLSFFTGAEYREQ